MAVVQTHSAGNGPAGLAVLPDGVWVANRLDGTVSKIDLETNVVTTLPAGRGPSGVIVAGDAVWVANEFDGSISRIDTATRETRTIAVGNAPSALAAAGDTLWVTVGARAPSHRGGTLRIVSQQSPYTIDPAFSYENLGWTVFVMTNDGLVGFRKVSGAEGGLLVPDLATSLPTPRDGGTTYTFQVRPGIRYSTGALVRAEDFRRAIERVYTTGNSDVFAFYDGIVGSDQCRKDPPGCDLSEGIQTSKGTVTFRLEKPDSSSCTSWPCPSPTPSPPEREVKRCRSRSPRRARTCSRRTTRRRASSWSGTPTSASGPPWRSPTDIPTASCGASGSREGRPWTR